MIKKLLNKNNLIIVVICLIIFGFPANAYAANNPTVSQLLRETIAGWYRIILFVCIAVMLIALIVLAIRALITQLAREKSILKEVFVDWVIGMIVLLTLTYFIYFLIYVNQGIVDRCKSYGEKLSGINVNKSEPGDAEDPYDETTLYETVVSKAYEIKFSSGTIGMLMYIFLLIYTIKFFFIYVRRYINVMVLILLGPIIVTITSFRKIISGRPGMFKTWVKELVYNIFIQSVHAAAYATLVGLTVKLSSADDLVSNALSIIGMFLTIIVFMFISQLDGLIRKLFNLVGGKTAIKERDYRNFLKHPIANIQDQALYFAGEAKKLPEQIGNNIERATSPGNLRLKARLARDNIKETAAALDGKRIKVSDEAIQKEREKMASPSVPRKIMRAIRNAGFAAVGGVITALDRMKILEDLKSLKQKNKDQLNQMKSRAKKINEKLNLNTRFLKILPKTLIKNVKETIIRKKLEKDQVLTAEEAEKSTVLELDEDTLKAAENLKNEIKQTGDVVDGIYTTLGPGAFLYDSSRAGVLILAADKEEERMITKENGLEKEEKDKKILKFPSKQVRKLKQKEAVEETEENAESKENVAKVISFEKAAKRYKFKRFNRRATATIVNNLNRRHILNNEYLFSLASIELPMAAGDMGFRGYAISKPQTSYEIVPKKITYKAKVSSNKKNEITSNVGIGTESKTIAKIMPFKSVKARKIEADQVLEKQHERQNDGKWAIYGATVRDFGDKYHALSKEDVAKEVKNKSNKEVLLEDLSNRGEAQVISKDVAIVFNNNAVKSMVAALPQKQEAIKTNVNERVNVATNQKTNEKSTSNEESARPDTKEEAINRFSYEIKNGNVDKSEILQATYSTLTDVAMKHDKVKFDVQDYQDEILESLSEKGLIPDKENLKDEEKEQILESVKDAKDKMQTKDKENYVKLAFKKAIAKTVVKSVDAGDKVVDKAGEIKQEVLDNTMLNNEYTRFLGQILKTTTNVKVGVVKDEIVDNSIENIVALNEILAKAVKDGADELLLTPEDITAKKEEIKAKARLAKPKRDKKRKNNDDKYDKDDIIKVMVFGCVLNPGQYLLKPGDRVYKAIYKAGGFTEDADYDKVPLDDIIPFEGMTIVVPSKKKTPNEVTEETETAIYKAKSVVKEEVTSYIEEMNISNIDALNKLVHFKIISSRALKKIQNMGLENEISLNTVESLLSDEIKDRKKIREALNENAKDMKVVNTGDEIGEFEETDEIRRARNRQLAREKYKKDKNLDEALRKVKSMASSESSNNEEENNSGTDQLLKDLLNAHDKIEYEYVPANTTKEKARQKYYTIDSIVDTINERK